MVIRKYILFLAFIAITFWSCSSGSANQQKIQAMDTLIYHPKDAGDISTKDFIKYHNAITSFYDTVLEAHGFNGAILVAKKGTILFEKYHGYANMSTKDTFTEHSAFHLASVSKTFTAMAILKLAEQGKLNLDDSLNKYFPAFPYQGITIKMLLSHRSGLPNYLYFMQKLGWDIKKNSSNNDVLDYLIKFHPALTSKPGTRFAYCNTNYALLGLIIEKASGETYSGFLQRTFFSPLGMNDTYVFTIADSLTAMPSYDWKGRQEAFSFLDVGYGDKNIYSTPRDLLKWDRALSDTQLFTRQTMQEAFTPYSNEKPGIKNYGYGWRMNIYPTGKKIIFHNGWWHGNNCVLVRLIEDSATIIVLGNKYNRNIYQAKRLANIFQPYFENDEDDKIENMKEAALSTESTDSLITDKLRFAKKHTRQPIVKKKAAPQKKNVTSAKKTHVTLPKKK